MEENFTFAATKNPRVTLSRQFNFDFVMRKGSKMRKAGYTNLKGADSTASSATSSSKLYQETSIDDGHSSPASSSAQSKQQFFSPDLFPQSSKPSKENVTVTVRFRPLSPREIRNGEEVAWYADGETIVRNENNPTIAYAYDRLRPQHAMSSVYDVAAHQVVNGAMEGINGTIFAYGVTSSGKTHTMHGGQRSTGIIPLAVKDAFSIIQETPNREFLLRISYLELYNEVVNDLLNPAGHNLRIREDKQGTFVEGIKEEVILSPAHALSLIAAGEVKDISSLNSVMICSRSHTIFTLVMTIESCPLGDKIKSEAVHLSQLNVVDLAGSESSKVISKLTDVKASHVPYRDSKLTRAVAELRDQLNERFFELEVKAADNRIIHEPLNQKETKIEELKLKTKELNESKEQLEHRNRKLAEESSYAKSLASAAAVELKALTEEVAKLMNHNRKLSAELSTHNSPIPPA
ncbi:hypothetical protein F2Q70_00037462 [Brassica cretica]|uniref:Kinesin-like protein n=1 Tax=Brassica cretica TaxID=69181 RepID=A0A8S9JSD9_BRACR|nr:hypothetical protein F2Q68_00032888 [Brassica cretica]KAF2585105.1 hypothetical protein F2Q70_00037462 [Brassica cretica]